MKESYGKTIEFIRQLYHQAEGAIPLHAPVFAGNEKKYLEECIDTTYVSSVGRFVTLFEEMTRKYTGAGKAVVCVNGTNALHLAMLLAGVKTGDEVITQPMTFVATCNAITYAGASPVFVDVDIDTLGMSPSGLKALLDQLTIQKKNSRTEEWECINKISGNRIKACIPMHTFGHPCRIDEIADICREHHIELIEDAAESIGSFYKGKHTGTFADIGILSFNGNKTITTGGGGMLLFREESLGKFAKHLTTQAKVVHPWEFIHDQTGFNYRMPNINAALGCAQLEQLEGFIEFKRQLASNYQTFFDGFSKDEIRFFKEPDGAKSNYWLNAVILENLQERDEFLKVSNEKGVMTRPAWKLMNKLPMFEKCLSFEINNALWLEDRIVNIPSSVNYKKVI